MLREHGHAERIANVFHSNAMDYVSFMLTMR